MPLAIRLWQLDLAAPDPAWARFLPLLDPRERTRAERSEPATRARFVRRRALLRHVLGALRHEPPEAVALAVGRYGHLSVPGGPHFSASSTEAWAVVAVADVPIGLDIEARRPVPEGADLAREWYPETWRARLAHVPADAEDLFLRAWVRLESLGKAMEVGIADRLRGCAAIAPGGPPATFAGITWHVHDVTLPGIPYAAVAAATDTITLRHEPLPDAFTAA